MASIRPLPVEPGDEHASDLVSRTGEEMPLATHAEVTRRRPRSERRSDTGGGWVALVRWIVVCLAAGWAGSLLGDPRSGWYEGLDKPAWQPPSALFSPVWTFLYIAMGIAAWRVWRLGRQDDIRWFVAQLALNFAWTPLFFGAQRPDLALLDIVALWCVLAVVTTRFWRADRLAGALLVPYLAWVTFATALNLEILRRNG